MKACKTEKSTCHLRKWAKRGRWNVQRKKKEKGEGAAEGKNSNAITNTNTPPGGEGKKKKEEVGDCRETADLKKPS